MGIAEKVLKVRGQRSRSFPDQLTYNHNGRCMHYDGVASKLTCLVICNVELCMLEGFCLISIFAHFLLDLSLRSRILWLTVEINGVIYDEAPRTRIVRASVVEHSS